MKDKIKKKYANFDLFKGKNHSIKLLGGFLCVFRFKKKYYYKLSTETILFCIDVVACKPAFIIEYIVFSFWLFKNF